MQLIDAVPDFTPMLPHVVYQLEVLAVICDENQRWGSGRHGRQIYQLGEFK